MCQIPTANTATKVWHYYFLCKLAAAPNTCSCVFRFSVCNQCVFCPVWDTLLPLKLCHSFLSGAPELEEQIMALSFVILLSELSFCLQAHRKCKIADYLLQTDRLIKSNMTQLCGSFCYCPLSNIFCSLKLFNAMYKKINPSPPAISDEANCGRPLVATCYHSSAFQPPTVTRLRSSTPQGKCWASLANARAQTHKHSPFTR